jgi:hypothetical protein
MSLSSVVSAGRCQSSGMRGGFSWAQDSPDWHQSSACAFELNAGIIAGLPHPLDFGLQLAGGMANQLTATGLGNSNVDLGTVLAYSHGGSHHCCAFLGRVQPWLLDVDHYYVALGSGKLSADPFLRFLVDIFCNGPPMISEAIFLTTWTIQHVIDTNPGGVAGPIRIAVLENTGIQWQARELPDDEIGEHKEAVESAASALREWRDRIRSGAAAEGTPEPPVAPAPDPPVSTLGDILGTALKRAKEKKD